MRPRDLLVTGTVLSFEMGLLWPGFTGLPHPKARS